MTFACARADGAQGVGDERAGSDISLRSGSKKPPFNVACLA